MTNLQDEYLQRLRDRFPDEGWELEDLLDDDNPPEVFYAIEMARWLGQTAALTRHEGLHHASMYLLFATGLLSTVGSSLTERLVEIESFARETWLEVVGHLDAIDAEMLFGHEGK